MAFLRTPPLPHLNKESSIRKASSKVNRSEPFCARKKHTGSASVSSPSSHTETRSSLSWKQGWWTDAGRRELREGGEMVLATRVAFSKEPELQDPIEKLKEEEKENGRQVHPRLFP